MQAVTLLVALALAVPLLQDKAAPKLPKKGDTIVVKGCLRGSALEATETSTESGDVTTLRAIVYRLTGNKDTLKKLRDTHAGSVVEVTGTLKSTLPMDEERGATIGGTRVRIGIPSGGVGSPANAETSRSIPVLDVKTYEGVAVKCGG